MQQQTDQTSITPSVYDKKLEELIMETLNSIFIGKEEGDIREKLIKDADGTLTAEEIGVYIGLLCKKMSEITKVAGMENTIKLIKHRNRLIEKFNKAGDTARANSISKTKNKLLRNVWREIHISVVKESFNEMVKEMVIYPEKFDFSRLTTEDLKIVTDLRYEFVCNYVEISFQNIMGINSDERAECVNEHIAIYEKAHRWFDSQENLSGMNMAMAAKEKLIISWESIKENDLQNELNEFSRFPERFDLSRLTPEKRTIFEKLLEKAKV